MVQYNVAVNGQTAGPFDMEQLRKMAAKGQFTPQSLVWKQGMAQWAAAGTVQELAPVFVAGAREFSTGKRVGMAALNPILGLGSYLMGDWISGTIVLLLEGAAGGMVGWELSLNRGDDAYLVPGVIAIAAGGTAVIFGIIMPFLYHRTPRTQKVAALMNGLDIALVPAAGTPQSVGLKTPPGVRISYSYKF
jgi:hypothetical protein